MITWIPHISDLPSKLRSAINQAYYIGVLEPDKSKIFHTFYTAQIDKVRLIIITSPSQQIKADIFNKVPSWQIIFPLTWTKGNYNCHINLGWEQVVSDMIKLVDNKTRYKVYMLIGGPAQSFKHVIGKSNLIIELEQPSDLTADIINETNEFIERKKDV